MNKTKLKKGTIIKALCLALVPAAAVTTAVLLFGKSGLILRLPPCPIRQRFHILCPGCGMTRAIKSLLELRLAQSIRYNPLALFSAFLLALFYFEQVINLFSPGKKVLPRSKSFYIVSASILIIYFVLRNLPFAAFSV